MLGGAKGAGGSKAGQQSGAQGSSNSTGPNAGIGAGDRPPGSPEDTKFKNEKLGARELNQGDIVGSLPSDDQAPKGDAALPVRTATVQELQRMAEKVDTEALPAQYREQVLRYMESLQKGAGGSAETSPAPPPETGEK